MFTNLLILSLLSSALAQPCLSTDFSLAMRTAPGNHFASLQTIGHGNVLKIVAGPSSTKPGTPATISGKSGSATLSFLLNGKKYGIQVPDLGESYGTAVETTATKDLAWPHFYYGDGEVEPELTAASQGWYACRDTIRGEEYLALNWGVYNSNGSAPWDCEATEVKMVYNIPCGN